MSRFHFVIVCFVVIFNVSAGILFKPGPFSGHDCDQRFGPRHLVECNACKCKQGNFIDCTKYRCTAEFNKPFLLTCVEREYKIGECEICQCYNETWVCEHFPCRENVRLKRSSVLPHINDGGLCLDGTVIKGNECRCNDGIWECGKDKTRFFSQQQLDKVPCSIDDRFEIDCRYCVCNANGMGYTCVNVTNCKLDVHSDWHFQSAKKYWEIKLFLGPC